MTLEEQVEHWKIMYAATLPTLRDQFAMAAPEVPSVAPAVFPDPPSEGNPYNVNQAKAAAKRQATWAYTFADAMLEARKKEGT